MALVRSLYLLTNRHQSLIMSRPITSLTFALAGKRTLQQSRNIACLCYINAIQHRHHQQQQYQQTRGMRLYRERTVRAMYWRGRSFDAVKFEKLRRDERQEWNYRSEIFAFSRRLQESLSEDTLRQIFAHPSYAEHLNARQTKFELPAIRIATNAELVRRGEQLLDECIQPYLRHTFDRTPEEGIVNITNYLKSTEVMADIANWIGCKDIILSAEWPPARETMADTVRAVLAGIETDLGFDRVQRFVVDMIISYINDKNILDDVWIIPNPQETFHKILANSNLPAYEPRIMFQTGIRTLESCYVIGLYVNKKLLGSSAGETLLIAEQCAALDALQRLFDLGEDRKPFIYGEASEKINYKAHTKEHKSIQTWSFNIE